MKPQHTPGPWMSKGARVDMGAGRVTAGLDWSFDVDPSEAYANARLIAAAPELLRCLEILLAHKPGATGERVNTARENARAALAKARGES